MDKILVSACLLGVNCRYKGDNRKCDSVLELNKKYEFVPICPEQLGGLPTPRPPAEQVGDRVINSAGEDVTEAYVAGAIKALELAVKNKVKFCVLKSDSPSCGKGIIYDGTFSGKKISGNGLTAALLMENGFKVISEEEFEEGVKEELERGE